MSDAILDLDALAPKSHTINFNGRTIEVQPPTTGTIMRLGVYGEKVAELGKLPVEEGNKIEEALEAEIRRAIPEIRPEEKLESNQLFALMNLLADMSMPAEDKELKDRGITADTVKKDPAS